MENLRPLGGTEATTEATREPNPDHILHRILGYVVTRDILAIMLRNANLHAPNRETIRPAARGDEHCWPYTKSPIVYNRQHFMTKIPNPHMFGNEIWVCMRNVLFVLIM